MSKLYLTIKFKFYRTGKSWTQQQYADYLTVQLGRPIARSLVQHWEHGRRQIEATEAMKLAAITGISFKELVERRA